VIRGGVRRAFRLALRRRDRWEREVEDEIKLHLALRVEQLIAQGQNADDAYAEAIRRFGPLSQSRARLLAAARHREHQMQRTEFLSDLRQDVAFAFRTLRRQKGWTAVTVLTLALGIGATTAVFSVVSSLLLHAVPYPSPDRVMLVEQQPGMGNNTGIRVSMNPPPAVVRAWRAGSHTFDTLEPYRRSTVSLRTDADPAEISASWILPSFAAFAGERPIRGRLFSAAEMENHARVALVSEGLWRTRYGADDATLGRTMTLNDSTYTIIGVMPAALRLPSAGWDPSDVWLPLDIQNNRVGLHVVGRLRAGATTVAAARELDTLSAHSGVAADGQSIFQTNVISPAERIGFRDSLLMLTAAVALVLLVACANVAHLMLARAATRHRELAIRAALGAGRVRIFRQLATESLLLTFAGAAAGVLFGWLGLRAMVALRPSQLVELSVAHLDRTTLVVTVLLAVASGLAFSVIGGMQSSRHSTNEALKAGSLATSHARGQDRLRSLLVISEMALSAMLIVGATLLIRSIINMQRSDRGFNPKGLYAITPQLPVKRFPTTAARTEFFQALSTRLRAVGRVRDVALSAVAPGSRSFSVGTLEIEGEPSAVGANPTAFIDVNSVEPRWFAMMGVRLVEGSTFTDTSKTNSQVIVNAAFARKHWSPGQALGHRLRVVYQGNGDWNTIVGVAADASPAGQNSSAPMFYQPLVDPGPGTAVMVRADAGGDLVTPVRALIHSMDPQMASPSIESTETLLSRALAGPRFTMLLLGAFTLLALVLAGVGLYGVMAYSVAQRTREIGIRMALGASQGSIARIVIVRGVVLAAIGAIVGLAGAYWTTRLIVTMLYRVAPLDAASFAAGAATLLGAAMIACVVPTRRALAVDPITAIRAD